MQNPFEYGRELRPGELADREAEVAEVRDALLGGMKHFLIGPRRYGKSSVHNVGTEQARARGATVMRYNVEAYPSVDDLLTTILSDAARLVQGPVEKTAKRIGQVFRALRPNVTYSPLDQSWSASLGVETTSPAVPRLVEVLHGLERLAARAERPTGLVLDEIQHLVAGGVEAERQVRAAVQEHRHVGYVFAGSDTRLLAAMTSDPGRPFYRLGEVRVLGEIPRPAFVEHLQTGFDTLSARVQPEALVAILDEAEDVPYNVQLLAHQCWIALRDLGRGATLTADRVRETHTAAARRLDPVYTQVWIGLTAPQRRALQAIVREGGDGLFGKAIAARYHLPAATMQKAIEGLITKGVCWRQVRAGATRVRLEDPLFGRWVRETVVPPARTP